MAATTYPQDNYSASDLVKGDFAADQNCGPTRVQGLLDLAVLLCTRRMPLNFTGDSHTGDTDWTVLRTFRMRVPEYATDLYLHADVEAKVTAGNADIRLTRTGTGSGILVNFSDAAYASKEVAVAAGAKGDAVEFSIDVRLSAGGNTVYVQAPDRVTLWFEDAA